MDEGEGGSLKIVRPFLKESGYGTEVVDGNRYEGNFEVRSPSFDGNRHTPILGSRCLCSLWQNEEVEAKARPEKGWRMAEQCGGFHSS